MEKNCSDDKLIFEKAMQNITPLKQKNLTSQKNNKSDQLIIKTTKNLINNEKEFYWRSDEQTTTVAPDAIINFSKKGVNLKTLNTKTIEYQIDLHGQNIDQAAKLVHKAIEHCCNCNYRQLKIITGKGELAILKSAVIHWLKNHLKVLGFKTAPNQDGGAGCLYVLIKRSVI
jgi:DNA-nicking Smr family endonuclease